MTVFSRELHWRQLTPGLLALAAILATVLFVLTQLRIGAMPGEKVALYALTEQARGVLRGSDVWLAGARVGIISDVRFLPTSSGTDERVVLELQILEEHMTLLRADSRGQVKMGARIIGNPVLHLTYGSASAPALQAGDTIRTIAQFDAEGVAAQAGVVMATIPEVLRDFRSVVASAAALDPELRRTFAPAGESGSNSLPALIQSISDLAQRLDSGTVGMLLRDSLLTRRIASIRTGADSLGRLYGAYESTVASFLDSTFVAKLGSVALGFETVARDISTRMEDFAGGARMQVLARELDHLAASMRALLTDARRRPFRYIVF